MARINCIIFGFLLGLICLVPQHVRAQYVQGATNAEANALFDHCMASSHPGMTPKSQGYYCACSAARMKDQISARDMKNLNSKSNVNRLRAQQRLAAYVYTPCLEAPIEYRLREDCQDNKRLTASSPTPEALCQCIGSRGSYLIKTQGTFLMSDILSDNQPVGDPLMTMLENDAFNQQINDITKLCVRLNTPYVSPPKKQRPASSGYDRQRKSDIRPIMPYSTYND